MSEKSNNLLRFWHELKRRKVIHVIVVYATSSFVIIELINNIFEPLRLPNWTPTMVIIILAIGFPFAIILSWVFDLTQKGIIKTEPIETVKTNGKKNLSTEQVSRLENSIAVLPFQDMSPKKDQEYFCDGITEEIINALTNVTNLKVIARTSAFAFKNKYEDIRKIGRELFVENILEGSVRKAGKKLRITAQLINVSDGSHYWSETYDREIKDIFEIQDEISLAIVDKLKVELVAEEKEKILKSHTNNLEAYNLYLKGRHYWHNHRTEDGLAKAMDCFRKAIESDPDYALAYTGLADTYSASIDWGYLNPIETVPETKKLLSKSLELDNSVAETYIGLIYPQAFFDMEWDKAEQSAKMALQLNNNSPSVHHFYAMYQMCLGNFDIALEHNRKARELDPLSVIFNFACGLIFYNSRQYEKSIEQYKKALALDNNFVLVHLWAIFPLFQAGQFEEIVSGYQKLLLHDIKTERFASKIQVIFNEEGISGFLNWFIEEGVNLDMGIYNHAYWKAVSYSLLQKNDLAFEELENVMKVKSIRMNYINIDPGLENIRSDPRFTLVLKRLKITRFDHT